MRRHRRPLQQPRADQRPQHTRRLDRRIVTLHHRDAEPRHQRPPAPGQRAHPDQHLLRGQLVYIHGLTVAVQSGAQRSGTPLPPQNGQERRAVLLLCRHHDLSVSQLLAGRQRLGAGHHLVGESGHGVAAAQLCLYRDHVPVLLPCGQGAGHRSKESALSRYVFIHPFHARYKWRNSVADLFFGQAGSNRTSTASACSSSPSSSSCRATRSSFLETGTSAPSSPITP